VRCRTRSNAHAGFSRAPAGWAPAATHCRPAGIVSGAGALKPGIVLGRDGVAGRSRPIALAGRVNCQVDARYGPVEVGSLLTTSSTPGHAMRAVDERRAFGAVIGKALAPLSAGQALVPILVALQ